MQRVRLGQTDLEVSRICFGCWQMSPRFWGTIPLEPWRAALRLARERGVNFIDTADAYGDGFAEEQLGEFLAREKCREEFVIATKFYWDITREPRVPNTARDYILRACESSLRRLRIEYIDLYQVHAWDPLLRPEEVADAFGQLRREGKVRWFGVSNWNDAQMRMGRRHFEISTLQPCYSLLRRDAEAREFPFCLEHGIGTLVYSPLERGLLTERPRPERFGDHRDNDPWFQRAVYDRIRQGVTELKPIAQRHGLSIAQLAVRWVLTHPAVTCAIVGIKSAEHLESILPAADGVLPSADWHEAANVMGQARREAERFLAGMR
ncbi:MAG: aldo/keto reductase [Verrucomicrobiae bacterium]|nr:aldo/keto reductase [Verrucomicrobiae bacterium]